MTVSLSGKRVWVSGHRGMVGSAIVRRLQEENCEILTAGRNDLDLTDSAAVDAWVQTNKPDVSIVAAAKVGGIMANDSLPAVFLYQNLMISANVIHASYRGGVEKLLYLGSSCIYPRLAPQPIHEDSLLTGPLEPTNEWYAIAKIAGIKLCQAYRKQYGADFISAMPTNLFGPGDNYDLNSSHVMPALIRKMHEAKLASSPSVEVWGSGTPLREFMYVDDLADACIFLTKTYSDAPHVNVGSGDEISIRDLAHLTAKVVGFEGDLVFDASKPDGTPRKLMDSTRLHDMGWSGKHGLEDGLRLAYQTFLAEGARGEVRAINDGISTFEPTGARAVNS
ncbi:GDP-L-fucose synthase [Brevundimonas sp. NIBR10]|uniref:GDP-L-fucose synthase n=1 Tax=Brevundimonas sp. NIBR10 TaxID=3015997 RepID=UPI0022F1B70D|nr:GDP-L-fucose synthase [Brevundimonas sp. NIBR10]WGM46439.1 GDP-L-fucose synthase [Brevundimonas sp. NIBR10]